MDEQTVQRLERGGFVCWGVLLGAGAAYDIWAFRKRKQTLSTAVWIVQRKLPNRLLLLSSWLLVTFHFFIEPLLKGKAKMVVLPPGTDFISMSVDAEGAIGAVVPVRR